MIQLLTDKSVGSLLHLRKHCQDMGLTLWHLSQATTAKANPQTLGFNSYAMPPTLYAPGVTRPAE